MPRFSSRRGLYWNFSNPEFAENNRSIMILLAFLIFHSRRHLHFRYLPEETLTFHVDPSAAGNDLPRRE
jgi:hypothetical protein